MAERLRNFISHRAGQAHWDRSLHLTWVLDNWDGAPGCWQHCPLSIGASTAPQDPSAWVSCRAWPQLAKAASPPLTAEMHNWGNHTCAVSPSPPAGIPQKPKKQAQSSFARVKKQTSRGEGRAPSDPRCKLRGYGRTHTQRRPTLTARSTPGPSALLFHSNKSRGGAGIPGCFLQEGEPGVPELRCCLAVPANSPGEGRAEPGTPRIPPGSKRSSAPFPQPGITQLEIMLLPVTSKPTGAPAKVNTSSSQFH